MDSNGTESNIDVSPSMMTAFLVNGIENEFHQWGSNLGYQNRELAAMLGVLRGYDKL